MEPKKKLPAATTHDSQTLITKIKLIKQNDNIGMKLIDAKGPKQADRGIYIKSIVPDSAAFKVQRFSKGDQLLAVNSYPLINITKSKALDIFKKCGSSMVFSVGKRAAFSHDLDELLIDCK